jgi:hypothetical protein
LPLAAVPSLATLPRLRLRPVGPLDIGPIDIGPVDNGTRYLKCLPREFGNLQPLVTTKDFRFSPDLPVNLSITRKDPSAGKPVDSGPEGTCENTCHRQWREADH